MKTRDDPRRWGLARYLVSGFGGFAGLIFVPFFLGVMLVAILIDTFGSLQASVWAGASFLPRFYALVIVLHVVNTHFPLHISHGGTRRQYTAQLAVFVLAHGVVLAGLMTLGFWGESLVAELFGWPMALSSYTFIDGTRDFGAMALTFGIIFVAWGAATALGSTSLYRNREVGGLGVAAGIVMVMLVESSLGDGFLFLGFLGRLFTLDGWSMGSAMAIGAGLTVAAMLITWWVARSMPVRSPAEN